MYKLSIQVDCCKFLTNDDKKINKKLNMLHETNMHFIDFNVIKFVGFFIVIRNADVPINAN